MIGGTNILHSWLCSIDHDPGGQIMKVFILQIFTSVAIVLLTKSTYSRVAARQLRFPKETNEFSKEKHFILDVLNTSSLMPSGGHIGQFIILVRTRRQSNTSHAALRFKTLQDILHTCYIATFGVLTFIVPQGHKNVLPFIECTDSETSSSPPLTNPPVVERDLTILDL